LFYVKATKLPAYTTSLTFKGTDGNVLSAQDVTLGEGYFMLGMQGSTGVFYAPVTADGIGSIKDANGDTVTSMIGIDGVAFVKCAENNPGLSALNNCQPKIGNGGVIGGKYVLTVPNRPNNSKAFPVVAREQQGRSATIQFKDGSETVDVVPSCYYYLVACQNGDTQNPVYYAPVNGTSGSLVFYDSTGAEVTAGVLEHVNSFTLKKFSAPPVYNDLKGDGNAATVEGIPNVMETSSGNYIISSSTSSTAYAFTGRKVTSYNVNLEFKDVDGTSVRPAGQYYVYAAIKNGSGREDTYYQCVPVQFTDNEHPGKATVSISTFAHKDRVSIPYTSDLYVKVALYYGQPNIVQNENDSAGGYGCISANNTTKVVADGSAWEGFSFSITSESGATNYVAKKENAYHYTVRVVDNTGNLITDSENNAITPTFYWGDWYLYASVTRSDGTYVYAERINDRFSEHKNYYEGSISEFYKASEATGSGTASTAIYVPGSTVSFALLRPAGSVNGDAWRYFASSSANINTNAMNNSAVDRKYTLTIEEGTGASTLTLKEGPDAEIAVTAYKGADDTSDTEPVSLSRNGGTYYIVGRMPVKSGTLRYDCYNIQPLSSLSNGKVSIDQGFTGHYVDSNANTNGDVTEYLTGARYFEPMLVFAQGTGSDNANTVLEKITGKVDHNGLTVTTYEDGATVGGYRVQTTSADREHPTAAAIKLFTLDEFNLAATVDSTLTTAANYSVLAVLNKDGAESYALLPINSKSVEPKAVTFTDASGNTFHRAAEDKIDYYVVRSTYNEAITAVEAGTGAKGVRFSEGQLTGEYSVSFVKAGDTVTAVLTDKALPVGEDHIIRVDMLNRAQTQLSAPVNPALSNNKNYYVLATLVPQGTNGPVRAWKILTVNKGTLTYVDGQPVYTGGLGGAGTWSETVGANSFYACDADGNRIQTGVDGNGQPVYRTTGYDSDYDTMKLRLYNGGETFFTYDAIVDRGSDEAPQGYDFIGVFDEAGTPAQGDTPAVPAATVVELRESYTKDYKVKVKVNTAGMSLDAGAKYIVVVKVEHYSSSNNDTYAIAPLEMVPGLTEYELDFMTFGDENNPTIWCNKSMTANYTAFTGNEKARTLTVYQYKGSGINLDQLILGTNEHVGSAVSIGESISRYTLTGFTTSTVDDNAGQVTHITDYVNFTKDNGSLSKGVIDGYLETATDFGLYTEILSVHGTDMESNIGADRVTGPIGADYGFSGNNIQVNRVKVTKRYVDENGTALPGKSVTLRLYPVVNMDPMILGDYIEKTGTTNSDGVAVDQDGNVLSFDKLTSGTYVLKEVIDGEEYTYDVDNGGVVENVGDDGVTIKFAEQFIIIENINVNYSYFGHIETDASNDVAILRHSRNGIIVVGDDPSYEKLWQANGQQEVSNIATVRKDEKHQYNIPVDMAKLCGLSQTLGDAASSQTVKIMNRTLAEVNANGPLAITGDGRYVVINVDVTGAGTIIDFDPHTEYDGHELHADFGAAGSEYSSKVLYNFITRDASGNAHPYTGHINTTREGSGVLLAPAAVVGDLGANWGGTIICHEAQHTGSEIHSDSANKIQNINTVLTNSIGEHKTGDLELQKNIFGESPDRTTWFTFVVTMKDENEQNFTGDLVASGTKDDVGYVHFDNGVAEVLVRAQNKVTITGIPDGYSYTVKEKWTDETDHYQLVQVINAEGETMPGDVKTYAPTATGDIEAGKTDVVKIINARKVGGLTIGKIVKGGQTSDEKFKFTLTLTDTSKQPLSGVHTFGGTTYVNGVAITAKTDAQGNELPVNTADPSTYNAFFLLGDGESFTVENIPTGYHFTITEILESGQVAYGYVTDTDWTLFPATGTTVTAAQQPKKVGLSVEGEILENQDKSKVAIIVSYANKHYENANYQPKVDKSLILDGTATEADPSAWPQSGFSFTISEIDGNTYTGATLGTATAVATASSPKALFGLITFDGEFLTDTTFTYKIQETIPEGATQVGSTHFYKLGDITYTDEPIYVEIKVGPMEGQSTMLEVKAVRYYKTENASTAQLIDKDDDAFSTAAGEIENKHTVPKGTLTITKTRSFAVPMDAPTQTYNLAVTDGEGNYYAQNGTVIDLTGDADAKWIAFTLPGTSEEDYTKTWEDLPAGTYTVEEQTPNEEGFIWTVTGLDDVEVVADQTAEKTVTNHFEDNKVDIPVAKTWEPALAEGVTWTATFELLSKERLYSVDGIVQEHASESADWSSDWAHVTYVDGNAQQQNLSLTINNASTD
ncbi:MAG: hypothetical protein IJJ45_06330, partial [Clostridia bacterium]|nr:hypothetical protein [Clostridia bacterium]